VYLRLRNPQSIKSHSRFSFNEVRKYGEKDTGFLTCAECHNTEHEIQLEKVDDIIDKQERGINRK
jgi:hypothetical protein